MEIVMEYSVTMNSNESITFFSLPAITSHYDVCRVAHILWMSSSSAEEDVITVRDGENTDGFRLGVSRDEFHELADGDVAVCDNEADSVAIYATRGEDPLPLVVASLRPSRMYSFVDPKGSEFVILPATLRGVMASAGHSPRVLTTTPMGGGNGQYQLEAEWPVDSELLSSEFFLFSVSPERVREIFLEREQPYQISLKSFPLPV
jgi:hypothetical protein